MIRDDCPRCGYEPLDYDSLMSGFAEVSRIYWCAECEWSMAVDMPEEQP